MSLFIPTIPQAGDNLDFSQGQLLSNNSGLDTVFGNDHYKFSDATTNKGLHKQVTFPLVGSTPYAVTGTNSYEYQKLLASNARSYLEYQPSGPDTFAGVAAIVPLSFKAYVTFIPAGIVQQRSFNISTIILGGSVYTITFNENMPDGFYTTILTLVTGSGATAFVASQTASAVQIFVSGAASLISVAVM